MGGEFFFMVLVAGVVATHCTLMMALWAGALGLPRADFPAGIAAITFGDSFHGAAPYWSGLFVIHLNGAFFAFLYATIVAPWLDSTFVETIPRLAYPDMTYGAIYGLILFIASGVFFQPVFLKLGLFLAKAHPRAWITSLMVHVIFGLVCGWLAPVAERIGG